MDIYGLVIPFVSNTMKYMKEYTRVLKIISQYIFNASLLVMYGAILLFCYYKVQLPRKLCKFHKSYYFPVLFQVIQDVNKYT